jgi:integration host factor beta subunit
MTKSELIARLSEERQSLTRRESEQVVNLIFDSIGDALTRGDRVEIRGFGSFTVRERNGRTARNPKSGALVTIPARKTPFFKTGKDLREKVNTP